MASFRKTDIDYAKLKQAASHYKGERGYCSLIAFAIATGCHFGKAKSKFKNIRLRGGGTLKHDTHPIYKAVGFTVEPVYMKGFRVENAPKRLPRKGTFLIYSRQHVSCLKDGVLHDWIASPFVKDGRLMKEVYQVT